MRLLGPIAATTLLLAACGSREDAPVAAANGASEVPAPSAAPANVANATAPRSDPTPGGEGTAVAARPAAPAPAAAAVACMMQGSERLAVTPLRATGTEPFWGARIEGRCVTYSHPGDPGGTRVWTRFTPGPGGGTWSGALGGQRFELRTHPQPRCSDGMSDKVYPIAVDLVVGGERRSGCAEPA